MNYKVQAGENGLDNITMTKSIIDPPHIGICLLSNIVQDGGKQ
jgi:hypothetical protein